MTNKHVAVSIGGALLAGVAVGRFTLPAKVVTKEHTVEVTKVVTVTDKTVKDNSHVKTTETKKPDGTVVTVTETDKNVVTDTDTNKRALDDKVQDKEKTVTYDKGKFTLNVITAVNPIQPGQGLMYGGSVTYRFFGPFNVGALGLSNGTMGASFGISF